jgi:hypothetical protein
MFSPSTSKSWTLLDLSQTDFYMSTTAHLQPLWSHVEGRGNSVNETGKKARYNFGTNKREKEWPYRP